MVAFAEEITTPHIAVSYRYSIAVCLSNFKSIRNVLTVGEKFIHPTLLTNNTDFEKRLTQTIETEIHKAELI